MSTSTTTNAAPSSNPILSGQMLAILPLLLVFDSMHFVFARLLAPYITSDSGALYVLATATVIFGLYAVMTNRLDWRIFWEHKWFFLAIGALIGLSTNLGYLAVQYIDAGTASMLNKLSTLFSVLFGVLWLHERFRTGQWIGALLALCGVFTIAFQPGDYLRFGALLVVIGTLSYSLHTALVKRDGSQIDFVNFFFFRVAASTAALFLIALARGHLVWPNSMEAWLLLSFVGLVDVVLSRLCFYWALRHMTMSVHSLILTVSPVLAVVWSYLLIGDLPTIQQLVGGAAVVLGVLLVMRGQRNR
ncbi:MAG: DMT family transporter [Caldilineaceae bacterium]|nr:DMT family transporter [Caldilineaceae bacterium]